MFDDAMFDVASHRMMLADVGLMSLYILDCQSLSELAGVLGKPEVQAELSSVCTSTRISSQENSATDCRPPCSIHCSPKYRINIRQLA
jgi:hypothetical protein